MFQRIMICIVITYAYFDVHDTGYAAHGANRRTRTTSVPVKKRPVGSLEGDVFLPSLGAKR